MGELATTTDEVLISQLENQHGLHGLLGRVYRRIGGEDRFVEWGDENPGKFFSMLIAATPAMQPVSTIQGDVNLVVHTALGPTELDITPEK